MTYLGDYAEDYATLNFCFSTHKADGTPIALAGTPALSVYKASNTTQSTAGITLDVDYDGVTGLNHVLIDLSADAFYAVANDYAVVITTGTVNAISVVGQVVGHFSIENRFIEADLVKWLGTAPLALSSQQVQAVVPTTQKVDIETVKTQAVTCAAPLTVNVNVGTTQPVNFTGTAASALVKSDAVDVGGTAQTGGDVVALLNALATALSPVSQAAGSSTDTTGTVISGTYANTDTADASLWVTAPVNPGGLDMRLNFALGANRIPVSVSITGWWNAATARYVDVYAYDYKNAAWNQLTNSSTRMAHRTTSTTYAYPLTMQNVDPATGNAIIRFASASTNTGDRLSLDRVVVNSVGGASGAPAGLTAEQVWTYIQRTLTSDTGEPIDTAALAAAVAALILITPANKLLTDTDGHVTADVTGTVTVSGNVTLAASQPNYAPAKAGDAMTLTSAYDAAKTGDATLAKQNQIITTLSTLDTGQTTIINNTEEIITNTTNITNIIQGGSVGAGVGSEECTIYVKDDNEDPIAEVDVWITATNDPDADPVASGKTDAFGVVQPKPMLDPGNYYMWREKTGEDFTNPAIFTVTVS